MKMKMFHLQDLKEIIFPISFLILSPVSWLLYGNSCIWTDFKSFHSLYSTSSDSLCMFYATDPTWTGIWDFNRGSLEFGKFCRKPNRKDFDILILKKDLSHYCSQFPMLNTQNCKYLQTHTSYRAVNIRATGGCNHRSFSYASLVLWILYVIGWSR